LQSTQDMAQEVTRLIQTLVLELTHMDRDAAETAESSVTELNQYALLTAVVYPHLKRV
jgi:hypothetical protein